jgi:3D (Asp-Asp-Asp) domain-containing protein
LERKILVVYRDGVEVARELKLETVVAEPVDHIIERGTGKHFTNSRGLVVRYSNARKMVATAYTAGFESTGKTSDHPRYGRTASGRMVTPHHTIAAPPEIPFGTKVYIPELVTFWRRRGVEISGIFSVEDRGSSIQGSRVDIYIEDLGIARIWGRRTVNVYFLR